MPKSIDKNDVDISTLFKWSTKHTIVSSAGDEIQEVFLRLVGDAEMNRSRVFGLRRSSELRKKLHDPSSDESLAYLPDEEFIEKPVLIETVLLFWTREYAQDALRDIKFNLPAEPTSRATLEEQEEYQEIVDEWPKTREEKIKEYIEKKLETKRKELDILSKEAIYKEYRKLLINKLCEDEMVTSYRSMCTYLSIYKDENFTERLFDTFEEFDNLKPEVKNQLLGAYLSLEIEGEDLKKLPEVTQ